MDPGARPGTSSRPARPRLRPSLCLGLAAPGGPHFKHGFLLDFYIMYFVPKYTQMIQNVNLTVLQYWKREKKKENKN